MAYIVSHRRLSNFGQTVVCSVLILLKKQGAAGGIGYPFIAPVIVIGYINTSYHDKGGICSFGGEMSGKLVLLCVWS